MPGWYPDKREDLLADKYERKQLKQRLESMEDLDHVERVSRDFRRVARYRAFYKRIILLILIGLPVIAILIYYLIAVLKGP